MLMCFIFSNKSEENDIQLTNDSKIMSKPTSKLQKSADQGKPIKLYHHRDSPIRTVYSVLAAVTALFPFKARQQPCWGVCPVFFLYDVFTVFMKLPCSRYLFFQVTA